MDSGVARGQSFLDGFSEMGVSDAAARAVAGLLENGEALPFIANDDATGSDCASPDLAAIDESDPVSEKKDVTDVTESPVPDDDHRPCFKVFDDWLTLQDGRKLKAGVCFFGIKAGKADSPPAPFQQFVCSPVKIEAVTFDGQENNFGRLLRIKNTLGRWREWAMPMELLRGAGDDLRGELLAMGVEIDPAARNLLSQ
jgi:putative DNA primase/helicase